MGYGGNVPGTVIYTWEFWSSVTGQVNLDGITDLVNITFQAVDIGETYVAVLNLPVTASGPAPSTTTVPAPYATPRGFSQDITSFLAPINSSEAGISKVRMFNNINVPGSANGTITAAQSQVAPDYWYNWVRDSSLTMDVVQTLYAAPATSLAHNLNKANYASMLFGYATARAQEQIDPGLQTGLGEPKFNLNNTIFTGPWGRPQNDGPATSAITLMEFATSYMAAGGSLTTVKSQIWDSTSYPSVAPVMKDLLFVASNWSSPSFDLWEEQESDHFYTRMVQHRALLMGVSFAQTMGDTATSAILSAAATALAETLPQFWDPIRQTLLYEYGPVLSNKYSYLDTAVILGVIHGYAGDGYFSYTNDQVLASAVRISTVFQSVYAIANTTKDATGQPLGIPIGRYPEDVYNGVDTSLGNPWFLTTAAMSEFMYRSSTAFSAAGSIAVTNTSLPFWTFYAAGQNLAAGTTYASGTAQFTAMVQGLQGWGDAYMRTIKYYAPANGHLTEEINRNTGVSQGALDLTWSYASVLTAAFARAEAMGNRFYVSQLSAL